MTLTPEQERAVLGMVADELSTSLYAHIEDFQLLTLKQAANVLNVGERKASALLGNPVVLGEKITRYPLVDIRRIIAERTVTN